MSLNPRKWKRDTDSLDLSGKKLTILEQPIVQSWKTTIAKLKLGSNLLKDFPWGLVASLLPNLRKLDLQQNNLSAIPDDISGFTALEELNVSNNKLVWISSEVQVLSRLRKLSLQHNCLKALPQEVTLLTDLVSLNVAHNQLRGVPLGLHALSHLRNLDLSANLLLVQDIKLVPKECSTILGYLRNIHNSIQADQPKFSVDVASSTFIRSSNTTEPRDDLWYLDHSMYYLASHTTAQSQGNRSYQEDRFVAFSKLKMHERVVELIETYGDHSVATAVATPKQFRRSASRRKSGGSSSNSSREPSPKTRGKRKLATRKGSPDEKSNSDTEHPHSSSDQLESAGPLLRSPTDPEFHQDRRAGSLTFGSSKSVNGGRSKKRRSGGRPIKKVIGNIAFYAVYDGHGGDKASEFLKDNLHLNFVNQKEELRKGDVCRALKLAFLESDRQFLNLCKQEGHNWTDGSTAICVLLRNNSAYIAHVGDSRAVLCRGKRAIGLSEDHKPDRPDEVERIEAAGGQVVNSSQTGWIARVNGHLAVSRSFGDIRLKEPTMTVTSEPEVQQVELIPDDQFILLASDGLWDVLDNQEAVDTVRKVADKNKAAEELVRKALKLGTSDNVSVIIVWLTWNMEYARKVSICSSSSQSSIESDATSYSTPTSPGDLGHTPVDDTIADPARTSANGKPLSISGDDSLIRPPSEHSSSHRKRRSSSDDRRREKTPSARDLHSKHRERKHSDPDRRRSVSHVPSAKSSRDGQTLARPASSDSIPEEDEGTSNNEEIDDLAMAAAATAEAARLEREAAEEECGDEEEEGEEEEYEEEEDEEEDEEEGEEEGEEEEGEDEEEEVGEDAEEDQEE